MSYSATETSVYSGSPIELFEFVYGPNYYRYVSGAEPVTFGINEFTPYALARGPIDETATATQRTLEVRAFRDLPVAGLFKRQPPSGVVSLILRRRHLLDTGDEFVVVWMGRVLNARWEGNEVVLSCEPDFTSVKRTGLRRHYQRACAHALYGVGCNLAAAVFGTTVAAYSVAGLTITVPSLIGQPDNFFAGGYVEYTNPATAAQELIAIRSSSSSTGVLSLALSPVNLLAPMPLIVYPGCDHTAATCASKFSNLANYGGQPYIPTSNPFSGKPIF